MAFYDNFVKITKDPKAVYKEHYQEMVNNLFDNASTYYTDVEQEKTFGSLDFEYIPVRVNTIVDAKTGQRVNDDYKKLIFKDLDYSPNLGTRFRFDENIWITFSTDNIKTDTSSVYVRRCNSIMNTQDEYGNIHSEPCYVDYRITETQVFRETQIDTPQGRIWVQCQMNTYTNPIRINDRFIFGNNVYKVREFDDYNRTKTLINDSVKTISFYADVDEISSTDNFNLGIANYKEYNYNIATDNQISQIIGFTNTILYEVYLNQNITNEKLVWTSDNTDVATINEITGQYTLLSLGTCKFIGTMVNRNDIKIEILVYVLSSVIDEYSNNILPNITYIPINQTQSYSVYEYKNGIKTNTMFEILASNVPEYNYKMTILDNNNFSIKNLKTVKDSLLIISCKNNNTSEIVEIKIELGGLF